MSLCASADGLLRSSQWHSWGAMTRQGCN